MMGGTQCGIVSMVLSLVHPTAAKKMEREAGRAIVSRASLSVLTSYC